MLHSYLRHKKKFRSSVGPLKLSSGSMTDDPALMANTFALAFAGVFASSEPPNPSPHQRCDAVLEDIAFTPADVQRVLRNLDVNSSMGPDGIHPHLLKACSTSLAYPHCVIFHLTLATGCLPLSWKLSHVIPIFKKGCRSDPLNYRPASLLSVPAKCLERFIFNGLHAYLLENRVLNDAQFGFRQSRSAEDQLLLTYDFISKHRDSGHTVDLIL